MVASVPLDTKKKRFRENDREISGRSGRFQLDGGVVDVAQKRGGPTDLTKVNLLSSAEPVQCFVTQHAQSEPCLRKRSDMHRGSEDDDGFRGVATPALVHTYSTEV